MKKTIAVLGLLIFLLPGAGYATPIYVDGIGGTPVGSSEMNGMKITVGFTDGNETIQFWNDGASETDTSNDLIWSLDFLGQNTSTLENDWKLTAGSNTSIDWFQIDALPGNVVFDIIYSNDESDGGTSGSDSGFWTPNLESGNAANNTTGTSGPNIGNSDANFPVTQDYGAEFEWKFSNRVYVKGASNTTSDLFSTLEINFTDTNGFTGTGGDAFYFGVDTDLVVPEPSTLLLFGVGLLGLGALGRRRR